MEIETKLCVEVKEIDNEGSGLARIATLDVIDSDQDLTIPGAFGEQHVKVLPTHNWGSVPLGRARVFEKGKDVLAEFHLNLETAVGKEWHSALKFDMVGGKPLQEWSYGFSVLKSRFEERDEGRIRILEELKVHEVSPVVIGSGVDTGTLAIKAGKRAVASHSTATSTAPWDGPGNKRRVRSGAEASYYRGIYAWRDPEGSTDAKSTWRFIHHFIGANGNPKAASTRAASLGIGILNGARGGTTIPEADRKGVWNHLAKHLRDADLDVPELRSAEECGVKLMEQITFTLWDVEALVERLEEVKQERAERGRTLGKDSIVGAIDIKAALEEMHKLATEIEALVREGGDLADAGRLLASFERIRSRSHLGNMA